MSRDQDRLDRIHGLIGDVYDAALDSRLWPDMGARVTEAFDSPGVGLSIQPDRRATPQMSWSTSNWTERLSGDYASYYWKRDIWANRALEIDASRVFVNEEICSDEFFENSEFYQDFCRKLDLFRVVGSTFPFGDGGRIVFGIHRSRSDKAFTTEDQFFVGKFLAHLKRALTLRQRLLLAGIERDSALDALRRTGIATIVVNLDGMILYANDEAERLLSEGKSIESRGGRVAAQGRFASQRLAALIVESVATATGTKDGPGGALALPREGRLPLTILVTPFRPRREGFGPSVPAAILLVRDPERPTLTTTILQGLFGLTASEAAVACALAEGKALDEIAQANRVSLSTVRTHLKNVLVKTGTNRQAELVALILRSVAMIELQSNGKGT